MFIDDACSILLIAKMGLIKIYWLMNTILGTGLGDHSAAQCSIVDLDLTNDGIPHIICLWSPGTNYHHWIEYKYWRPPFIGATTISSYFIGDLRLCYQRTQIFIWDLRISFKISNFSSKTSDFHWRPQILIGDLRFSLETSDFCWKPQAYAWRTKFLFTGDFRFLLETARFSLKIHDIHRMP